jgi:hypothetical protein
VADFCCSMSQMDAIAVLWGSCGPSAKLEAVDVLLLKWVRCVYNSLPGFDLQFYLLLFVVSSSVVYGVVFLCTSCNVDNGVCVVARVLLGSVGFTRYHLWCPVLLYTAWFFLCISRNVEVAIGVCVVARVLHQ